VKRLLSIVLVVSLFVVCSACGNVFVGGVIQPGTSSVDGLTSIIQFSVVDGNASVTFVTFLAVGTSSTIGFCGDQRGRFPMNQNLRVSFNPGQPCGTIVSVVVL
jgi:hypothetical protein